MRNVISQDVSAVWVAGEIRKGHEIKEDDLIVLSEHVYRVIHKHQSADLYTFHYGVLGPNGTTIKAAFGGDDDVFVVGRARP